MSRKLAFAAAAALVAIASPAYATDYNIGSLTTLYKNNPTVAPGAISDTYNFTLPHSDLAGGIANVELHIAPTIDFDITGLLATLYDSSNNVLGSFSDNETFSGLVSGAYHLTVTGTAVGASGGIYALALDPAAPPTPGPAAYLVMAAGVGVIGWRSRKLRQNKAGPAFA